MWLPCTTALSRASSSASSMAASSPATQQDPLISLIKRSTSGEIALISLGIQASISKKEPAFLLGASARRSDAPFRIELSAMASAPRPGEMHRGYQSLRCPVNLWKSLICGEIANEEHADQIRMLACYRQGFSRLLSS